MDVIIMSNIIPYNIFEADSSKILLETLVEYLLKILLFLSFPFDPSMISY